MFKTVVLASLLIRREQRDPPLIRSGGAGEEGQGVHGGTWKFKGPATYFTSAVNSVGP